uniref:Retrotransposon protein-like n=1 Tax=Oryza nivara TaxID=4536 RepID=A0A679BAC7_ORYNI|nr:retrotransposon protein-like [Oryza sativa f. spontanea]
MLFAKGLLPSSFFGFQRVLDGQVSEEEDIVSCLPKLRKTAGSASEVEEAMFNREKGKNVSGYASSNSSFQLNLPLASRELSRAHPWSLPSMLLSSQLPLVGSQDQNQYVFDRAFATQVNELPMPEEDVPFCHDCREQGHYALNCPWVYVKEAPSLGLAGQTSLNQPPHTKSSLQPSVQSRELNGENPLNPGKCFPPSLSYHVGSHTKQAKGKKSKNQKRKAPMRTEEEVRKMTITSTEWPPAGITIPRRQRGNTFRGARQLTQHLLSRGGRVSDSEGSDHVSSDEEDESPRHLSEEEMESKACPRCGEIGHVASMCLTLCPHCEEDHPPGECPTRKVTCFLCEGTNHVPKDCQLSVLLTKTAEIQRTTLRLSHQLVSSNSNIDDIIHSTNAPPAAPDSAINHSNNTFNTNHSLHRQPQQRIVVDKRSRVSPRPTPGRAKGNQLQEGDTKQKTVIRFNQQSEGTFSWE